LKLTTSVEDLKQQLSYSRNGKVYIECYQGDTDLVISMSRAELDSIFAPFYDTVSKCTLEVTQKFERVDKVVLVGGTCKIPYLSSVCKKNFPDAHVCTSVDPMTSVSIGASIGGPQMYLDDVVLNNPEYTQIYFDLWGTWSLHYGAHGLWYTVRESCTTGSGTFLDGDWQECSDGQICQFHMTTCVEKVYQVV
jgi:hypothetical protein